LEKWNRGSIKNNRALARLFCIWNEKKYYKNILFKTIIHESKTHYGLAELLEWVDCKLMLDLKWNDIPNTLKNYITQLSDSGLGDKIEYITLHASGWREMLKVARETKDTFLPHAKLLAITALTSLDDTDTAEIFDNTAQYSVLKLAKIALDAGIEGIVCSTHEASALREVYGDNFDIITPWVRFAWWEQWDQKRVKTPGEAIRAGVTNIVMGRPILQSENISESIQRFFTQVQDMQYISI